MIYSVACLKRVSMNCIIDKQMNDSQESSFNLSQQYLYSWGIFLFLAVEAEGFYYDRKWDWIVVQTLILYE